VIREERLLRHPPPRSPGRSPAVLGKPRTHRPRQRRPQRTPL